MRTQYRPHQFRVEGREKHARPCNLCERKFEPRNAFVRFCSACRERDELLRFNEWLPQIEEEIVEKMSA